MKTQFKNVLQILDYYKDSDTCKKLLVQQRWNGKPCCPHCGHDKVYTTDRGYKCAASKCLKKFSVTVGTIFENSKISLRYWFAAIYICTAHKKGVSSHQLSRDLGITQKTAWFMLQRIREMLKDKAPQMLEGEVEIDETYIGAPNENKHRSKRKKGAQGRSLVSKKPVFGLLSRDGYVYSQPVNQTNSKTLIPIMVERVAPTATIYTDEFSAYRPLAKFYAHGIISHKRGEYVRGDIHVNNIENYWSQLKRGIIGVYHQVTPKHLHRYCYEFSYRFNTRNIKDSDRFVQVLSKAANARITYKELTA